MFNSKLKKELQDLRDEFEQYKYDQSNLPKYKEGEVLKGGAVITKVTKNNLLRSRYIINWEWCNVGPQEYTWSYKAVKNKKIINVQ